MQIKYALFCGLFLFLISCGSRDNDPVDPDTSKTTIEDKKETGETTDKKEETTDKKEETTEKKEEKTEKKEEKTEAADKNTPPIAAVLTAPADGATAIALNNIDFSWNASTDADGDDITYDVYLDENNPPTTKIASNLSGESTSLIDGLKGNTTYYWYVTTKDGKEDGETKSEINSFTTTNTPPTAAMLTAPADAATNVLVGHILSWDAGTDADGDALIYELYLDENNPPTTNVPLDVTILSAPISQANAPEGSTTYYWFVTTKDGKGGESNSEVRSFTTAVRPVDKAALKTEINAAIGREGNNVDLGFIDTSLITDMSSLFRKGIFEFNKSDFNGDVSKWNTSNVKNMEGMFFGADSFNGDLSKWDVSNVENMRFMFYNGPINFNSDLREWDVGKVKTMEAMFQGATSFNADLSEWDVSNVTNMGFMFHNATNFEGGDLRKWDVSKVTTMESMFYKSTTGNDKFNGNISTWDVRNVTNMSQMFQRATSFNQDISGWRPTSIKSMALMFESATSFNQNLESWNIASSVSKTDMFKDSGVETKNLPSWYNP